MVVAHGPEAQHLSAAAVIAIGLRPGDRDHVFLLDPNPARTNPLLSVPRASFDPMHHDRRVIVIMELPLQPDDLVEVKREDVAAEKLIGIVIGTIMRGRPLAMIMLNVGGQALIRKMLSMGVSSHFSVWWWPSIVTVSRACVHGVRSQHAGTENVRAQGASSRGRA